MDSVLNGGHYNRYFEGLMIVEQAIDRLKWEAFWLEHAFQEYQDGYVMLNRLQSSLIEMTQKDCKDKTTFVTKSQPVNKLLDDFGKFSGKCSDQSEMCKYWETYLVFTNH